MIQKVTVGLQQKIGQPNFGSLGASCCLELQLAEEELADPRLIDERIEQAYVICRNKIEQELGPRRPADGTQSTFPASASAPRKLAPTDHANGDQAHGTPESTYPQSTFPETEQAASQQAANQQAAPEQVDAPTVPHVAARATAQPAHRSTPVNQPDGSSRPATEAQVRAICAIAPKAGVLLNTELQEHFGVLRPGELTLQQASHFIDYLKAKQDRLNRSLPVASPKMPSDDLSATDIQSADASA